MFHVEYICASALEQRSARVAHNHQVTGSNPVCATSIRLKKRKAISLLNVGE